MKVTGEINAKRRKINEKKATTRYFYALKIYGAILPQNKQILCCYFTIKQHWTIFSREILTVDKELLAKKEKIKNDSKIF